MKLPSFKRLFKQDFKADYQALIEQLGLTINTGFDALFQMGNNGITLKDNIMSVVKNITVTVDTNGTPINTTSFSLGTGIFPTTNPVVEVRIGKIVNNTDSSAYTQGGVTVFWTQNGSQININNIKGLIPNNSYTITLIAQG